MKSLTLTIVIPVYNEESYIKACLEAISVQTDAPDEVLIIDNNCSDRTIEIARQFPFVRVLEQPIQGLIAARNLGLDAAKSDLVARIDADSRIAPDWVEHAKESFRDTSLAAITGPAYALTTYQRWIPHTQIWPRMYFWWTEAEFGIPVLWGANMVMRKTAWHTIRDQAHTDDTFVHEDQDLSYLLAGAGLRAKRKNNLLITIDGDGYHGWTKFSEYANRRWQTKRHHAVRGTLNSRTHRIPLYIRIAYVATIIPLGFLFLATSLPLGLVTLLATKLRAAPTPAE